MFDDGIENMGFGDLAIMWRELIFEEMLEK